ncbi:exonuclease domain-containing protein [Streptomyces sp. NBC_01763]|uniref:exonuclease domain-containing protein n=1 Tax=Streptomyces sp. NBC_01763 TaxID=2975934 RepID=UPI002DDBE979|nr:exonuclease domain-containing protein [Streptomyces sp. NBC_01763]WSC35677.1 exonuclease domain-containing protein [Streptomyces sp. NBC_01763]
MSWHRRPLVGVDFETTGVDPENARIVTGCVVRFGGGQPSTARSWLSDAGGVEIPAEATAVHGIDTEAARSAGRPAPVVIAEITDALAEDADAGLPIVAMNAQFDLTLLDREARRYGIRPLFDRATPCVIDPRVLDKKVDRFRRGSRTLTDLCRHYVVQLNEAHTAEADAVAACAVAWKLANRHPWLKRLDLADLHEQQVHWAREQAEGLRDHFARTDGKQELAASVRLDWPLVPAPRAGVSL